MKLGQGGPILMSDSVRSILRQKVDSELAESLSTQPAQFID